MPETDEINKTLGELEEELSKVKSAADMLGETKQAAETNIRETKIAIEGLIEDSKEANTSFVTESGKFNQTASKLLQEVDALVDKLDKSITGINTSIQNIFGRFDSVERNLKDELRRSQKWNMLLLIGVIIISGASLVLLIIMR